MPQWLFPTAIISTLVSLVEAKLPFTSHISSPSLVLENTKLSGITFDPLGVLAIISNPRASASAARLYVQPHRNEFRWPHVLQVGATLDPISMLVRHLTSPWKSVHPAEELCRNNMEYVAFKQDLGSDSSHGRCLRATPGFLTLWTPGLRETRATTL